ncbi:MAG TPA: MFS transporter [Thermomicrobiaceae bacterium]|nr:MFS transporter [Thermomicrobiaceae bacterium]
MRRSLPPALASLAYRDFTLLWAGQFISTLGTQIQTVALGWLVYTLTGSVALLGGIGLARAIPTILLSLFGGTLADQVDRRRLLLLSQTALAACSALLAIAIQGGLTDVVLLYTFAVVTAAGSAVDAPTRQAFIPALVPRENLANALTLNVLAANVAAVAGPAAGGLIIGWLGTAACYWLDAVSFFAVVAALVAMRARPGAIDLPRRGFGALVDGLTFVRDRPILWQLMVIDFFAVLFASRSGLLPVFAESVLKVGAEGLGLLYAAVSFGAVFGAVLFAFVPHPRQPGRMVGLTILAYGAVLGAFGLVRSFPLALMLLALSGGLDAASMALRQTVRQLTTPDSLRGRVGALSSVFSAGGPRLGDFQSGMLASMTGAGNAMVIGGLACMLMVVTSRRWGPELWRYRGDAVHLAGGTERLLTAERAHQPDADVVHGAE